jgi:hypothetical protein
MTAMYPSQTLGQTPLRTEHAYHDDLARRVTPDSDAAIDSLIAMARNASEAFSDRGAAIAAGYRRVGKDFPSMGEHWVNPRLVFDGRFDVARPAILTYSIVQGHPTLLGVVYAIPLAPGEDPPAAFGPAATWHEHNGSLEEESLLPEHHSTPSPAGGTRLAVLHVWVRAQNPDGVFTAENWALPFIRLGLDVPTDFPKGAARAISLLSGGERYFRELAGAAENAAAAAALERCANVARTVVSSAQARGQALSPGDLIELERAWNASVLEIRNEVGADAARRTNGGVLPGETHER